MATITTSLTYTITVLGPLSIDPLTLSDACNGSVYPSTTFTASGGLAPYTWDATGSTLPSGMSLNTSTGNLHGTVNASGSFNLHLTVTDANFNTATTDFPFTVFVTPTITTTTIPDGIYNTLYTTTLAATAGSGALGTWVVIVGSLPGGLTLNSSTGVISGTITSSSGYFPFIVRVTDSNGCYFDRSLSINVTPTALVVVTTSLPGSCRGTAYSQTLTASGGAPAYTWAITVGTLPSSLSLDSGTGVISGTIDVGATVQVYNFTVQVTDSGATTATRPLSIEVYQEPVWVTTDPLPGGNLTIAYSVQLNATGAATYAVQSGSLPTGLTLSSGGLISGTPTVGTTFSFTIRATSAQGCFTDKALNITIGAQPPSLAGTFSNICNRVNYYNDSLVVTGGAPPFIYTVTSGFLPDALTLNVYTGIVSGVTAVPGDYSFEITVTDANNLSGSATFGFTIYDSPDITQDSMAIPPGIYGRPYSHTFVVTGGSINRVWYITGTLPTGLVFNSIYGSLSGTPLQSGHFPITISVQDINGCVSVKPALLIIKGPPVIDPTQLPPACQNQDYGGSGQSTPVYIQVNDGLPPYYFFIVSDGFPPQDLILNPYTGQLSGVPLIPGTYFFTVKVVDQNDLYATKDYVFIVRSEKECGQPDEGKTQTIVKTRLSSLESQPIVVEDPFHQKHLYEYLPAPFVIKNE